MDLCASVVADRVLVAEGKHLKGRSRCKVGRYAYQAKRQSDCHQRLTRSSEGSVQGEQDEDHKNLVNNQQEIHVEKSKEPIVLK